MPDPGTRRTVTILAACELCDVSRRTIYNWLAAGRLEVIRTAGGSRRIYVDSLFQIERDPRGRKSSTPPAKESVQHGS